MSTNENTPAAPIYKQLDDAARAVQRALRAVGYNDLDTCHFARTVEIAFDGHNGLKGLMAHAHMLAAHADDTDGIRREIIDDALYVIIAAAPICAVYAIDGSAHYTENDGIPQTHHANSTQYMFGVMTSMYPRLRDIAAKYADVDVDAWPKRTSTP